MWERQEQLRLKSGHYDALWLIQRTFSSFSFPDFLSWKEIWTHRRQIASLITSVLHLRLFENEPVRAIIRLSW